MNYGRAVKTIRAARRLTQQGLASAIGADASYISMLEANKRTPSAETLDALGRALDVPVYLISLLASDPADLRGVDPSLTQQLAGQLLSLITTEPKRPKAAKRRPRPVHARA
jgi:transcriptional regulator with XRE-family HTH domain